MEEKSSGPCLFPCSRTFVQLKINQDGSLQGTTPDQDACSLARDAAWLPPRPSPYDGAPAERARNCTGTGCATLSWTATSGFGRVHGGLEEEDAVVSRPQPRIPAPVSPRAPSPPQPCAAHLLPSSPQPSPARYELCPIDLCCVWRSGPRRSRQISEDAR
jgi:hypothetical protein